MNQVITQNQENWTIHIVLTSWCNQGCPGCNQSINDRNSKNHFILNENTRNDIKNIFNKIPNNDIITVAFFGGEPLTRHQTIMEIIDFLSEENIIPNYFTIPTSGGKNQNLISLVKDINVHIRKYPQFNNTIFKVAQSYDGPNNLYLRNEDPGKIKESIKFVEDIDINLRPSYTSTLIPQIITEDYFIDSYKDIKEVTNRIPNYRIPYLLETNSNLDTIVFSNAITKFLNYLITQSSSNFILKNSFDYRKKFLFNKIILQESFKINPEEFVVPKLFSDVLNLICSNTIKDTHLKSNWCGAGTTHHAIDKNGIHPNGCEYINEPANILHNKMLIKCSECEIKDFCNKPCLKNLEESYIDKFERQCTVRKILLNQIIKFLKKEN